MMKLRAPSGRQVEVAPTLLDKCVNYLWPQAGNARMHARGQAAMSGAFEGYAGGRRDSRMLRNWRRKDVPTDDAILLDLPDLRGRSDDLYRNTPVATGAITTTVNNAIGTGLQLQASINPKALGLTEAQADAMEEEQEREFALFCKTCDFTGGQIFDELQPTKFRAALLGGDAFTVRRFRKDPGDVYGTKLQTVVAARVCNPDRAADTDSIIAGVEVDKDGVPLAYHVADKHPNALLGSAKVQWERVPAWSKSGKQLVIHFYDRLLPDQTRGVPFLAPVVELIKAMGNYTDGEVSAAVLASYFTVFVKGGADDDENPSIGERVSGTGLETNETTLGKGAIVNLGSGESIEIANPGRPNANFDPFMQAILRQIAVALGMSFEVLVGHFTASYSASRAAIETSWQSFCRQRVWLARRYCQVVYEWFMEEAVASGRLNRSGFFEDPLLRMAYCGAEWIGPTRISINPQAEAEADKIDVLELRVKTREQVALERTGGRIERKLPQLGKEQRLIEDHGLNIPMPGQASNAGPSPPNNSNSGSDHEAAPKRSQA